MPILWGLVVGVFIYFVLREMGEKHTQKNKKPSRVTLPTGEVDAKAPSAETEPSPAAPSTAEADTDAPSVETGISPEEKTDVPPFIDTIPGLPRETRLELRQLELTTSGAIRETSDKKLLAIKGIGAARLKQIRSLCADAKE